MSGAGKKVEVRFGAFSCSIEGYDDPIQQMREVLLMMQQMIRETPALVDHGADFGEDELAQIEHALDHGAEAGGAGRIVVRGGGRNGREEAEDAVTTAEIPPEGRRSKPGEGEDVPVGSPAPESGGAGEEFAPTAAAGVAPVAPEAARSEGDGGGEPERPLGDGTGAENSEAGLYAAPVAEIGDADFAGIRGASEHGEDTSGEGEEHPVDTGPEAGTAWTVPGGEAGATAGDRVERETGAGGGGPTFGAAGSVPESPASAEDALAGAPAEGAQPASYWAAGAWGEAGHAPEADQGAPGREKLEGAGAEPATEPGVADGGDGASIPAAPEDAPRSAAAEHEAPPAAEAEAEEGQPEFAAERDAGPAASAAEADREPADATSRGESGAATEAAQRDTAAHAGVAGEAVRDRGEAAGARPDRVPAEATGPAEPQAVNIFAPPPEVAPVATGAAAERGRTDGTETLAPPEATGTEDIPELPEAGGVEDVLASSETGGAENVMAPPQADGAVGRDAIARGPAAAAPAAVTNIFARPEAGGSVPGKAVGTVGEAGERTGAPAGSGAAAPQADASRKANADAGETAERRGAQQVLRRPSMPLLRGADARGQTAPAAAEAARRSVNIFAPRRESPARSGFGEQSRASDGGHAGELRRAGGLGAHGTEPREPERPSAGTRERGISGLLARLTGHRAPESNHRAAAQDSLARASQHRRPASPADLAERAGARTVPDLLAVAGAWLTLVEGRPHFTRGEAIEIFEAISGDHPQTIEARIQGHFGELVQSGRVVAVNDRAFVMSRPERERFRAMIDGG